MAIVLIGILNLFWCSVHAQFKTGYPTAGTIAPSSGTNWYTDGTRARVIHIQNMGTFDDLVLDAANDFGFNEWQAGDRALLIQMKTMDGATSGIYRELEVNGYKLVFKDNDGLESANYFSLESDENYYLYYDLAPSGSYRADYSRCFPDNPRLEEAGEDTYLDEPRLSAGNDGNSPQYNTPDGTYFDNFSMDIFTALTESKNENENKVDLLIQQNIEQVSVSIVDMSPQKEGDTEPFPMHIVLRDMQGRSIATYVSKTSAYQINLKGLSAGVYLVHVTSGEKQNIQKIIIQ
jgi:hypothetical protein